MQINESKNIISSLQTDRRVEAWLFSETNTETKPSLVHNFEITNVHWDLLKNHQHMPLLLRRLPNEKTHPIHAQSVCNGHIAKTEKQNKMPKMPG